MEHIQPGIYIEQQTLPMESSEMPTAVPVFIGYTKTGGEKLLHNINTFADYMALDDGRNGGYLYAALQHYFAVGGEPCFVLSVDNQIDKRADDIKTALIKAAKFKKLATEDTITLIAMPDLALLNESNKDVENNKENATDRWLAVYQAILETCKKQNWFAVLDSPAEILTTEKLALKDFNTDGEYGAAYWPYLLVDNGAAYSDQSAYIPPSAAVAAMMQRIDRARGIWKAPANDALPQVIATQHDYPLAQNLFKDQSSSINVIRSFAGRGVRVWGCRTLAHYTNAKLPYIQMRRLLTHIELNLTEVARFVTFEPNNAITWIKLKGLTQVWLRQLWFRGGLYGATEEEAFRVLIGLDETMTDADIQAGKLIMRVCIAALYPAEFIDLTLQFHTSESNVAQHMPQAPQQDKRVSA